MNITDITEDALMHILSRGHFTITQLLTLRAVCTKWNAVITRMFLLVRSIKLFGSVYNFLWSHSMVIRLAAEGEEIDSGGGQNFWPGEWLRNVIHWKGPAAEAELLLPELFPNLDSLFFCCAGTQLQLSALLERWPNQLSSLAIWSEPPTAEGWADLWKAIHTQHSTLRSLALLDFENLDIPEACQLLEWIHELTIKGHHSYQLDIVLSRLGPSCTTVALEQVKLTRMTLENMIISGHNEFLTSLTIGEIDDLAKSEAKRYLEVICTKFRSLVHFYPAFASEHLQVDEIHAQLSKLPRLTSLRLRLHSNQLRLGIPVAKPWLGQNRLVNTFPSEASMSSVTKLIIDDCHFEFFTFKTKQQNRQILDLIDVLGELFSEVQQLKIRFRTGSSDKVVKDELARKLKQKTHLKKLEVWQFAEYVPMECEVQEEFR